VQGISTGDIVNLNVCEEVNKVCYKYRIESWWKLYSENCEKCICKWIYM